MQFACDSGYYSKFDMVSISLEFKELAELKEEDIIDFTVTADVDTVPTIATGVAAAGADLFRTLSES